MPDSLKEHWQKSHSPLCGHSQMCVTQARGRDNRSALCSRNYRLRREKAVHRRQQRARQRGEKDGSRETSCTQVREIECHQAEQQKYMKNTKKVAQNWVLQELRWN